MLMKNHVQAWQDNFQIWVTDLLDQAARKKGKNKKIVSPLKE